MLSATEPALLAKSRLEGRPESARKAAKTAPGALQDPSGTALSRPRRWSRDGPGTVLGRSRAVLGPFLWALRALSGDLSGRILARTLAAAVYDLDNPQEIIDLPLFNRLYLLAEGIQTME